MKIDFFKRVGWLLVFLLAQVVALGRIHLFGVATPLFYVYFVLLLPPALPKWASLLWGFTMGLLVDVFMNTPGLAATSLTFIAAMQPYYAQLFLSQNAPEHAQPTMRLLGPLKYTYYCVPLVVLYSLLFFTLEQCSFFDVAYWALCVVSSAAFTLVLIFTFEIAKKS